MTLASTLCLYIKWIIEKGLVEKGSYTNIFFYTKDFIKYYSLNL